MPNSYVYRFSPTDKSDLTRAARSQALQILRARRNTGHRGAAPGQPGVDPFIAPAAHLRHVVRDQVGDRPHRHDRGRSTPPPPPRPQTRRRSSAPRTASSVPGTGFRRVLLHRDRRHEHGEHPARRLRRRLPAGAGGARRADTGRVSIAGRVGDKEHTGLRQHLLRHQGPAARRRGRRRRPAHPAQRARLRLRVRPCGRRRATKPRARRLSPSAGWPRAATPRRRSTRLSGPAYNDGDNEITGIHVSDGDPTVGGLLGAKLPQPSTRRLAHVLDPAARRQHHVGDHRRHPALSEGQRPTGAAPRPEVGAGRHRRGQRSEVGGQRSGVGVSARTGGARPRCRTAGSR